MKNILLIDGENFKGKMSSVFKYAKKEKPKWHKYDFGGLFEKVLAGSPMERKIFYFAKIIEHEQTREKSKQLIEDQRLLKTHLEKQGFEVVLAGRVRGQIEDDSLGKQILVFKEKGVDVKIAVDMVSFACDKVAEEIFLASSDSDMQPAVNETKKRSVKCVYVGFETQPNKGLSYNTDRTILIRNNEVMEFSGIKKSVK